MLQLELTEPENQGHTQVIAKNRPAHGISDKEVTDVQGILMNDLLEVITFKKAVLKIDIEGYEYAAMFACEKLFRQIYIPFVFMEWLWQQDLPHQQEGILRVMGRSQYEPFALNQTALLVGKCDTWPSDVLWKHYHASFPEEYLK